MSGVTEQIKEEWIEPLELTYALAAKRFPPYEFIAAEEMPEPYRTLLVHNDDMTPTLESFYGETTELQIQFKQERGTELLRQVVLLTEKSGLHVEFGAITISLNLFDNAPRQEILECRIPLGTILNTHHIEHYGKPAAFFRLTADDHIKQALRMNEHDVVYGRCNAIYNCHNEPLARIVEVLPPAILL